MDPGSQNLSKEPNACKIKFGEALPSSSVVGYLSPVGEAVEFKPFCKRLCFSSCVFFFFSFLVIKFWPQGSSGNLLPFLTGKVSWSLC